MVVDEAAAAATRCYSCGQLHVVPSNTGATANEATSVDSAYSKQTLPKTTNALDGTVLAAAAADTRTWFMVHLRDAQHWLLMNANMDKKISIYDSCPSLEIQECLDAIAIIETWMAVQTTGKSRPAAAAGQTSITYRKVQKQINGSD
jgi:hypothetical protein